MTCAASAILCLSRGRELWSREKFGNSTKFVFHSTMKVKYDPAGGKDALSRKRKPSLGEGEWESVWGNQEGGGFKRWGGESAVAEGIGLNVAYRSDP
ncbi:hypothetical protein AVEN_45138-1 [Araneus ventricosus]|uniref:Uncharacterized protein n=1 Tax=Araneus ventricosus TaxID=182803 RepID=A0A4Y2GST1_ARAVE|nr:hypothetical protein AVEN_45138-1 [Araneus ventricosus]